MTRLMRSEHGARIAAWLASEMLEQHLSSIDLFPVRLSPAELDLWVSILEAADHEIADAAALRAVNHG